MFHISSLRINVPSFEEHRL